MNNKDQSRNKLENRKSIEKVTKPKVQSLKESTKLASLLSDQQKMRHDSTY